MATDQASSESRPGRRASIHPAMTVRQVATDYPACRDVFRRHGEPERISAKFGHLEPLDRFAQRHGVPLDTLLAEHPGIEDHLIAWGLRYLGRVRSVPAELTLGSLAVGEGFDPEALVARINVLLGGHTTSGGLIGPDGVASCRSSS
jgi:hypothetical protein